jgi:Uma2 family endonuclease
VRYIGSPKLPTLWVYHLVAGEYQAGQSFQAADSLRSQTFSELKLTMNQIAAML